MGRKRTSKFVEVLRFDGRDRLFVGGLCLAAEGERCPELLFGLGLWDGPKLERAAERIRRGHAGIAPQIAVEDARP